MATSARRRGIRRVKPDEQLTLVEHLDELRQRIIVVLAVLAIGLAVCFWQNGWIYDVLTNPIDHRQHITHSPMDASR